MAAETAINATVVASQEILLRTNPRRLIVHPLNSMAQMHTAISINDKAVAINAACSGPEVSELPKGPWIMHSPQRTTRCGRTYDGGYRIPWSQVRLEDQFQRKL